MVEGKCSIQAKRRHTVKTQFMVNNRGYIIHKVAHKKGCRHDYDIYKMNHAITPKEVVTVFDLGYLSVEKDFLEQISPVHVQKEEKPESIIARRKRVQPKSFYKENSDREHTICRIKKYRILADVVRNKLMRKYD